MTRAASNRKNGTATTTASSRPGPVFKGRDVVFVDPLDDKESYWWPAMIVPVPEIDSSMDCTALSPGECLVKYFEDNKYSVVQFKELQPFVPTTIPFLEFELAAGQKFLKNGGVVNALAYLESGKVKRKFSWHRWGTAQEQELSLDSHKHKAINLPLVSDEAFAELSIQQQPHIGIFPSASSSPATSTKHDTDTENDNHDTSSSKVNGAQSAASAATPKSTASEGAGEQPASSSGAVAASTAVGSTTARQSGHQLLKNGLQRSLASVASSATAQSASTLLPSPVSLHDLTTEPADETEFGLRSSKARGEVTKGSPVVASGTGRRSRRGSRDNEGKGNTTAAPTPASKETTRRSRNTSEVSSSSASSVSGHNSSNGAVATETAPTTSSPLPTPSSSSPSISTTAAAPNTESPKKRKKTIVEIPMLTDSQNGMTEARPISGRSSREGSAEPTVSPRSTRHSSRKATDKRSGSVSDDTYEPAVENTGRVGHAMTRMTRQRSAPKSASSLPGPDSSVLSLEKIDTAVNETEGDQEVKGEKETDALMAVEAESETLKMETEEAENKTIAESTAMDVDVPEPTGPSKSTETKRSSQEEEQGQGTPSIPPPLSLVSAEASASSSPSSSSGPESEQATEDNVVSATNNGLLQSLERERQEMSRNFEHVLPTLAIGSKEREAFYENCMDHLQRLRQEHRRLKDILKSSEYLPKGRRATRSSPQYHSHHHRHHHHHHHHNQQHLEEKPNHRGRSSPAPLRYNSQSSDGGNGNKENTQSNGAQKGYSKAEAKAEAAKAEAAAKAKAEATAAAAALATEGNGGDAKTRSASTPASSAMYQGSTPSSAILTSNIATTTRRSAATAAAAAVAAAATRPSRQAQNNSNGSKGAGPKGSKKRSHSAAASSSPAAPSVSAAMAAEVEAAALAAVSEDGGGPITTRAKRRQR